MGTAEMMTGKVMPPASLGAHNIETAGVFLPERRNGDLHSHENKGRNPSDKHCDEEGDHGLYSRAAHGSDASGVRFRPAVSLAASNTSPDEKPGSKISFPRWPTGSISSTISSAGLRRHRS